MSKLDMLKDLAEAVVARAIQDPGTETEAVAEVSQLLELAYDSNPKRDYES